MWADAINDIREAYPDIRWALYDELTGKDEGDRHRIEIVHESLLRAWPRLVRWQAQDEEGAVLRDQLKQAAHLWDEKNRTPDLLWSGTAFREYELWRERYPGKLTALEEDFSSSMVERARRRRRIRRLVATSVVAAAVVVAAVVVAHCSAFGGRCPAEAPPLLDDDVFWLAATGATLALVPAALLVPRFTRRTASSVAAALMAAGWSGWLPGSPSSVDRPSSAGGAVVHLHAL